MEHRDKNERAAIREAAAEWFIRLRDSRLNESDRRQYLKWLQESPSHVAEMLRISSAHALVRRAMKNAVADEAPDEQSYGSIPRTRTRS